MKNADMPAMPSDVKAVYEAMTDSVDSWGKAALGLTKREMMAMHMMAHLMMNERLSSYEEQAGYSIKATDALLAELGRTNDTR